MIVLNNNFNFYLCSSNIITSIIITIAFTIDVIIISSIINVYKT
jgi:hypothetical protein